MPVKCLRFLDVIPIVNQQSITSAYDDNGSSESTISKERTRYSPSSDTSFHTQSNSHISEIIALHITL